MENIKIGDSDELVTVTKKRWDDIQDGVTSAIKNLAEVDKGNTIIVSFERFYGESYTTRRVITNGAYIAETNIKERKIKDCLNGLKWYNTWSKKREINGIFNN